MIPPAITWINLIHVCYRLLTWWVPTTVRNVDNALCLATTAHAASTTTINASPCFQRHGFSSRTRWSLARKVNGFRRPNHHDHLHWQRQQLFTDHHVAGKKFFLRFWVGLKVPKGRKKTKSRKRKCVNNSRVIAPCLVERTLWDFFWSSFGDSRRVRRADDESIIFFW